MIEQVSDGDPTEQQEDMPSEDTVDKKGDMCPDCGNPMDECECEKDTPVTEGKVLIDTSEIDALMDGIDL